MRLKITSNGKVVSSNVKVAESFVDRGVGLMFKSEMVGFDALLIDPCKSIHTFFMRYDIDVLFIDSKWKVIKIKRNMKPWRMTGLSWRTSRVLELKGGGLISDVKVGDILEVQCINWSQLQEN